MEDPDAAPPPPVMAEPDAASIEATRQVPVTTMLGPVGPLLRHSLMVSRQSLAPDLLSADAIRLLKVLCISLKDMSEDEDAGILARWWMKIVRELCYDTEDHLDGASAGHRDSSVLRSFFRPKTVGQYPSGLRAREKYEFSGLFARAKDAIKKRTYFERTTEPYWGAAGVSRPMSPDLLVPICDRTKAGVVKLPKELLELLALDDERKTLKVIPISGCAGVGKTTVARTLYHQHAGKFQCRAFVTVSQKPYTRGFLTSMLSQLKAPRPDGFPDVPDLIDAINKHLQGKRYLVVIDDLWTASIWNIISHAFPRGNSCSRIITTTEIADVALACCSYHPTYIYKMEPLNDYKSIEIFFGIKEVPNTINEKLKHKQYSEQMKAVLELIYCSLPPRLRTCLLYLSVYAHGYVIKKDELLKLWVAEGFLSAVGERGPEEIAEGYFDELVSRGMVQTVDTCYDGEVLSCSVHKIVLDFIRQKSREENFVITADYFQSNPTLPEKVRRLSVQFGGVKSACIPESIITSHVRSLIYWGFFKCVPSSIMDNGFLRVLVLHIWADKEKESFDLTGIGKLFLLKYVKIESNITVKLPGKIRRLQYLETLHVDARLSAVPTDTVRLKRLLHLHLPSKSILPNVVGQLTCLRTLGYFDIGGHSEKNVLHLGGLTNLQDLQLTCSAVRPAEKLEKSMQLLGLILAKLRVLQSVTLVPAASGSSCVYIPDDAFSMVSPPSDLLLRRIELSRHCCIFFSLPKWFGELRGLCILKIGIKRLSMNDTGMLKGLPALVALTLHITTAPAERIFIDKGGFKVLTYFKFICAAPCLFFLPGALPKVQKLIIGFNSNKMKPDSIETAGFHHLTDLTELSLKFGVQDAEESHIKDAESQLEFVLSYRPKTPIIRVHCVDVIFCGEEDKSTATDETELQVASSSSLPVMAEPDAASLEAARQVPVTVLLGPVGPLLRHSLMVPGQSLAPNLLSADEIRLLKVLCISLKDMSEDEDLCIMARGWMKIVRELCYDTEDHLEEVAGARAHYDFSALHARVKDAIERRKPFPWTSPKTITKQADPGAAGVSRSNSPELPVPVCGRSKDGVVEIPKELVRLLDLDGDKKLKVIPVIGHAAIGKTTVAKALYHSYGENFECRAFVTVSRNPVMSGVLTSILSQLKAPWPRGFTDVTDLINAISKHLQDKRYFIVIDDLWDVSEWTTNFSRAFPHGNSGSRILTTTRFNTVASACHPNYIYKMEDSFSSMSEGMEDVVNIMYNSFPPRLRTCLLYLSLYALGCVIKKDELVKQWAVEGFLGDVGGRDTKEIAEGYFDELVRRGLVQGVDINHSGEVLSCTVRQLVLDFIREKSMEENFIIIVDNSQSTPTLPNKVRRLSVQFGGVKNAWIPESIVTSHVRSLVVFSGSLESVPCITDYGLLRVLVLHIWTDEDNKSLDLTGIAELFLLKYLKIRSNMTVQLPEKIQGLQQLETLQVHAPSHGLSMVSLPPALQILKLSRHCCIFSSLPEWIGGLVRLCILKIAIKELSGEDIDILKRLPSLTALTLYIETVPKDRIVIKEGFKVLTYFKFICATPCLSFAQEAMAKVQKLKLGFNANKIKPHSFRITGFCNLAGLTEVSVKLGGWFAENFDRNAAKSALESAVWNPLNTPLIKVQHVDVLFSCEEDKKTATEEKEGKRQEIQEGKKIMEHSEEHVNKQEKRRHVRTGLVSMKHHAPSADVVTGAFGSLLPKLLELLKDEYNLEVEIKGKVKSLYKLLEGLQAPLREVAELEQDSEPEAHQRDEVLNAWARDVRDLSYDADDIVDSLSVSVEGSDPDTELKDGIESLITRTFALLSREKDHHEIASAMGDSNVFMGEVIEMLRHETGDVSKKLKIVSIVGMGGLGKTILAKAVYDKIQAQYDCSAFVSVSREPYMKKVYMDILYQIDKHMNPELENLSESNLVKKLVKRLANKRYLIVIDDIWDIKSWKSIESALIDLNCGSNVVITTRIINIAEKVGGVYKLKALPRPDSKVLFNKRLLCGKEEVPSGLPEVSEKLLSKCGGVPIAIITMASMLVGKTMDDWSKVYNNIGFGSEVGVSTDVCNARKILLSSYYYLPCHLRACLLLLHIYPYGCLIKKETLIWKWAAEGLVVEKPGTGLFELGEGYLKELINKNMVLPVEDDSHPGKVTGCRVEDLVFKMICSLSTQENFATVIDGSKQYSPVESKARRLAIQDMVAEQGDPLAVIRPESLRSFNIMGCHFTTELSLSKFKLLRVLAVEECTLFEGNLSHLGKLLLLRYLGLNGTPIDKLPAEIGDMVYLQTLDLRGTRVKELPGEVAGLRQLKCLRADESTTVPDWMGDITSLEELRMGKVSMSKNFVNELGRLAELREVEIWIEGLDRNQNNALGHFMRKLEKIQVLKLMGGSSSHGEPKWGDFIPPENLPELYLISPSYRLPAWINVSRVPMLSHLYVNVKAVEEQDLDILGALPKLISLVMLLPSNIFLSIKGGGAFSELQCFHMSAPFRFEAGAMRKLDSLHIKVDGIAEVKFVASTLGNLHSIKKVEVQISSTGDADAMHEAIKGAVGEHRNFPSLSVVKTDEVSCMPRRM